MTDDTQFKLGTHEGRLSALETNVGEIKGDVKKILGHIEQSKGASRASSRIAAFIGGVFGTVATFAVEWLRK